MRYVQWSGSTEATNANFTGLPEDLWELTASEAAALVQSRRLTSRQLVESWLTRIDGAAHLNAFVNVDRNASLLKAEAYDEYLRKGGEDLPLGGVPIAVKDNIQVVGFANTAGTPGLEDFWPNQDAVVVSKLLAAGAIVVGKTNMDELAFGASGYNTAFHCQEVVGIRNAFDPSRIAGGSSGGSASAVGARLVPIALGTDTGGSIRQPCSLNGCVGFRPTVGRYSRAGIVPISLTRDTPGPMARSVEDIGLIDRVLTGEQELPVPAAETLRLGVLKEFWDDIDDAVAVKASSALKKLRNAGIELVEVSLSEVHELNARISMPVAMFEARGALAEYLAENRTGLSLEELVSRISSPAVKSIFADHVLPPKPDRHVESVDELQAAYTAAISQSRPELMKLFRRLFENHSLDAIVFPTTPELAIESGPQAAKFEMFARMIRNVDPGSNASMPGISLPIGLDDKMRLPVGLELDGLPDTDRSLLALAIAVEKILGREVSPCAYA